MNDITQEVTLSYGQVVSAGDKQQMQIDATEPIKADQPEAGRRLNARRAARLFAGLTHAMFCVDADGRKGSWRRWSGVAWIEYPENSLVTDIIGVYGDYVENERAAEAVTFELTHQGTERQAWRFDAYDRDSIDGVPKSSTDIMLRDRVLVLKADGSVSGLRDHKPTDYNTGVMAASWAAGPAESTTCPKWQAMLKKYLPDAAGRRLLQAMFGYMLCPSVNHQVIFCIAGPARTGKTTVVRVLEKLMGQHLTSIDLAHLSASKHETSALMYRRRAVINEADRVDHKGEAVLKALSGGDLVRVEQKYKTGTAVKLRSKLILVSNDAL